MIRLKPCPFCGSTNIDIAVHPDVDGYREDLLVFCKDCHGAMMGPSELCEEMTVGDFSPDQIREIVDNWNKRCDGHGSD